MDGAGIYRRYLSGDDSALAELIRAYADGLTNFLTGVSGSAALAEELTELRSPDSPEDDVIRRERTLTVRRALKDLNPDYRQALELVYFQGFTNEEAARIMRKTRRQTENLLYRAKRALAGRLEKEGITHEDL